MFEVYFEASGSSSMYGASLEFLWSQDEEKIVDFFDRGDQKLIARTYRHDLSSTDTFIVGFNLTFGENSGCNGRTYKDLYTISYDDCDFYDYSGRYIYSTTDSPTPVPTILEPITPEPTMPEPIVPEPTTPEPITPVPIASIEVVSCCGGWI